jgi:hypothetical protein
VVTFSTDAKFPNSVDTTVDISFTKLFVANAPKFTGEYGDTKNGLLLFEAKLSAPFLGA